MSSPETVTVVKAFLQRPNGDVLVLRRSQTDDHRPGGEDVPGGAARPGEDEKDALTREIFEETGAKVGRTALRRIYIAAPTRGREALLVRHIFNGLIDAEAADHIQTNPAEHESAVEWVPRAELREHLTSPYQEAYDRAESENLWAVQEAA